jgi:tRNA threonylcarbamoyladenosine biosynthesis protein TsaB
MSEPGFRRVLAFDCSGASCSAALWVEGRLAAERFAEMERGQAETLMPQIQAVMAESGLDFPALDALATTIGPGSFTGLRLGLAAARGLALAAERPIVAMTSFEALLAGLPADAQPGRPVAIAIDSRRGPVFAQLFWPDHAPLGPPASVEPADFDRWLPPGEVLVLADRTADLPATSPGRTVWRAAIRATDVARLAARLGPAGIGRLAPAPLYLRAPDVTAPKKRGAP